MKYLNKLSIVLVVITTSFSCENSTFSFIDSNNHISLFDGKIKESWQIEFKNDKQSEVASQQEMTLTDQTVSFNFITKQTENDALQLRFKDTWFASLEFSNGHALDLSRFMSKGLVSFDIRFNDMHNAALDLKMSCGNQCEATVRLREWALKQAPQEWYKLAIPLACFRQRGGEFSEVTHPFTLVSGGKGQFSIANIEFSHQGKTNFECPNLAEITTTPAMLNEYWSEDWWLPRHQAKLAQRNNDVELLMIGDSITQGWEQAGKEIWQQEFANINSINLGFGGDRTENVLWRIKHGAVDNLSPKLAVIMLGTNNTGHRFDPPKEIYQGVEAIITELNQRLPNTQLVLFSIFPRGAKASDKLRINNQQTNLLLDVLALKHNVQVLNINNAFLDPQGNLSKDVMPDLLHPNSQGYQIWADKLKPIFTKYLTKT